MIRLVCAALAGVVFLADPAIAAPADDARSSSEPKVTLKKLRDARGVTHEVEGGIAGEEGPESQPAGRPTRGRTVGQPVVYATFPTVAVQPDGARCVRYLRRGYPDAVSAAAAVDAQNALWRLAAAAFPACARTPAPEAPPPAARAAEYWRVAGQDLLPRPAPRIAPGYMLAGKLAYLEAGTQPRARFEHATPAGVLTIEATARTYVDWGDGSGVEGPLDSAGGPWPDGTITHYWTHVGRYDVRVVQRWSGRWSLGGQAGELAGLVTEGVIEGFRVEEVQAVRNW